MKQMCLCDFFLKPLRDSGYSSGQLIMLSHYRVRENVKLKTPLFMSINEHQHLLILRQVERRTVRSVFMKGNLSQKYYEY